MKWNALKRKSTCARRQDFHSKDSGKEKLSVRLARFIIHKQSWIGGIFLAGCIFSLIAMLFVNVNYDLTEYLPDTVSSHIGLELMREEFGYPGTGPDVKG